MPGVAQPGKPFAMGGTVAPVESARHRYGAGPALARR
jgi:hypothetical protein